MIIRYILKLVTVCVSLAVFIGIPYLVYRLTGNSDSWALLLGSWIPASIVFSYLSD